MLDPRTLLAVITIALVTRAALMGWVWHVSRHAPARFWAIGSAMLASGVLLASLRDSVTPLVTIVVAQALMLPGWALIDGGIVFAAGRTPPWRTFAALSAVGVGLVAWYALAVPDFGGRTVGTTLSTATCDVIAAIACLRAPPNRRTTGTLRILGVGLALLAASNVWKLVEVLRLDLASLLAPHAAFTQFFLVSLVFSIASAALFVLLAAQALEERLDRELDDRRVAGLVFDHTNESIMVTDRDGAIVSVNPAFTRLTGYAADEVVGRSSHVLDSDRDGTATYAAVADEVERGGTWSGELWSKKKNGEVFAEARTVNTIFEENGEVQRRVALFHDITEEKRSAELVFQQANFDRLTGLPNRYLFLDRLSRELSRARRTTHHVALLFLDLDHFKPVNDTYGHEVGDRVLELVAQRWQACVRASDTLARLGGDEFALIASDLRSPRDADPIARKLLAALEEAVPLPGGRTHRLGVSIGVALYPENATEMDSLIAAADTAMYRSKGRRDGVPSWSADLATPLAGDRDWIVFDDALLVGVDELDTEHRELVRQVNQLNRRIQANATDEELRGLFEALTRAARDHFAREQGLMVENDYPGRKEHSAQHTRLLDELRSLYGQPLIGHELKILQTLKDWLVGHIATSDRKLGAWLASRDG
ncbi:bacteriohemerythrin [Myxococcota bacterium]|nr:bacteriohemerythrin [Myxococcota bacterium]